MPFANKHLADKALVSLTLTICLASSAFAATITGNVTGPDGKPFMGAFVVAENTQNKMTVNVLSDQQGRYHIGNLPAADLYGEDHRHRLQRRSAPRRGADRRAEGFVRLRAEEDDGALGGSEHLSGPAAAAQDQGPRSELSGSVLHHLLPVLPLVPDPHDADRLRRGGLARARQIHARHHHGGRGPAPERREGRGFRFLSHHRVRPQLAQAEIARGDAAVQIPGASVQPRRHEHRLCGIRLRRRQRARAVERGRGQGRDDVDPVLRPRQRGGAAQPQDRRDDPLPAAVLEDGRHSFGHSGRRRHRLVHRSGARPDRAARSRPPRSSPSSRTRRCRTASVPARTPSGSTSRGWCG